MADIKYQCPQCGNDRMVSEFADPEKIMCRDCDCHMQQYVPNATGSDFANADHGHENNTANKTTARSAKKNKLKLARDKQTELPDEESPGVVKSKANMPEETVAPPLELHPKKKHKKSLISQPLLAFVLFLIVGGISGYLRYGIELDDTFADTALDYAWGGILFLHFCIVAKAFTADMMQGILCFFIPGWSFVYLALSDHFYQKAIIFGLLVGIGMDGGQQLLDMGLNAFETVQHFINTGGG